jgi:hypothetical protein
MSRIWSKVVVFAKARPWASGFVSLACRRFQSSMIRMVISSHRFSLWPCVISLFIGLGLDPIGLRLLYGLEAGRFEEQVLPLFLF